METIRRLTLAVSHLDHGADHADRVARYAAVVGVALNLAPGTIDLIRNTTGVHDIGKVAIPTEVLIKPGPLDDEEWRIVATHPSFGAKILAGSTSDVLQMAERIALAHHERWDGGGYPFGLAGEDIPIEARICAVAESFDAMTVDRPFRKAVSNEVAIETLRSEASTKFDPTVLAAFLTSLSEIEAIQAEYL